MGGSNPLVKREDAELIEPSMNLSNAAPATVTQTSCKTHFYAQPLNALTHLGRF
jgi:hypothetical protein